ncbi:hypothetical protein L1N85_07905 [Paenibacillus alkaliterrae]|uniref:hypothetical protein n=1 Tax=Paenibacillus alkaliterrae TaxID=320909 RepID=UPI001F233948|nr:hypothetical protein [Paenibacillus alkaliterrae]MCF2938357.1 hypothetical protein [Paenibacillus alkaliterrae]
MREKSNSFLTKEIKQNSQQPKEIRGGVTKVMKKKLAAFVLSSSMVLSLTVPAFAAATETDPGKYLQDLNIIAGDQNGDLMEDSTWKRQDVAVLVSRLLDAEAEAKATAKSHTYADVRGTYYDGFLSWAKAEGLLEGHSATDFGFDEELTYQQFAAVVLRALGVDTTGANYANVPALAVEAGIVPAGTDFTAKATRGETYAVLVTALNTEVPGTGKTLGQILELEGFDVEFAVSKAEQTGAKTLSVEFATAAAADATVVVKNGFLTVDGEVKFAENRKSATFVGALDFVAGTYTIEVTGTNKKEVKVEAAAVSSVELLNTNLQAKATTQDVLYKAVNQFGEVMTVSPTAFTATAFNITKNRSYALTPDAVNNKFTITAGATGEAANIAKDDSVLINLIHNTSTKSAQKTVTVVPQSSVAKVELGAVAALKDTARITVGDKGLVLPIKLYDQYNQELPLSAENLANVVFVTNNPAVVRVSDDAATATVNEWGLVTVDGKQQLQFAALNTAGTVTVTAFIPASASQSSTSVTVNAAAALKTVTIQQPAGLIVAGEKVEVAYQAIDQYDASVKLTNANQLVWFSNNTTAVPVANIVVDGDKKLQITPAAEGVTTINGYLNGQLQGTIVLDVKATAVPSKITGLKATTVAQFVNTGAHTYAATDFAIVDQYNRVIKDEALTGALTIAKKDAAANKVTVDGTKVTGSVNLGEETLTATYAGKTLDFKVNVVAESAVVDYDVTKPVNTTLYSGTVFTTGKTAADYVGTFVLKSGLDVNGKKVAVAAGFDQIISSNADVVVVDTATYKVNAFAGSNDKEAVVTVVKKGKIVAQVTFKTSNVAPAATTVSFKNDVAKEITAAYNFAAQVKVVDQYGVDITAGTTGAWYSSDSSILAIVDGAATIPAAFTGEKEVTVTYVTSNAKVAAVTVKVKK